MRADPDVALGPTQRLGRLVGDGAGHGSSQRGLHLGGRVAGAGVDQGALDRQARVEDLDVPANGLALGFFLGLFLVLILDKGLFLFLFQFVSGFQFQGIRPDHLQIRSAFIAANGFAFVDVFFIKASIVAFNNWAPGDEMIHNYAKHLRLQGLPG